jgi:hypothetical protein
VVFAMEAIARRKLVSFLATAVAVLLLGFIVLGLVAALITSWRATLVVLLLAAALACLVANLRELVRT